ncbi:MAG TPA: VOC family protein [Pyrinomonadaceae bacterium]|nr:VOC family protein [Pyrinomonadaceae bacterium]
MSAQDPRPSVWVGHVILETDRLEETEQFMRTIGMRSLSKQPEVAVLELRGGTHLVLLANPHVIPRDAAFDLMVDDLHAAHEHFAGLGLAPSAIEPVEYGEHERFFLREPAGHRIAFYSSHVSGAPV